MGLAGMGVLLGMGLCSPTPPPSSSSAHNRSVRSAKGVGWRTSSGTADFLEGVTKGYGVCVKGLELTLVVGDVAGGSWSQRTTGVSEPLSAPLVRLPFLSSLR